MSTLTEFLLARIAEDEARANHAKWAMQGEWFTTADDKVDEYVCGLSPARVLAECEAKRRIVESYAEEYGPDVVRVDHDVLRELASVHAEHPDYREEWRR